MMFVVDFSFLFPDTESEDASVYACFNESSDLISHQKYGKQA